MPFFTFVPNKKNFDIFCSWLIKVMFRLPVCLNYPGTLICTISPDNREYTVLVNEDRRYHIAIMSRYGLDVSGFEPR